MKPLLDCPRLRITLRSADGPFCLIADGFKLHPGETTVVTGPSGSGKSLFLEMAALVRRPDDGSQFWFQDPAGDIDLSLIWTAKNEDTQLARLRRNFYGFVPQAGELFGFLSVRDNIALSQRMSGDIDLKLVDYLIAQLDLGSTLAKPLGQLSVGQRQRVAIARAMATRPRLVVADEPTAALDHARTDAVIALFADLAREFGTAVILATHDVSLAETSGFSHWACATEGTKTRLTSMHAALSETEL